MGCGEGDFIEKTWDYHFPFFFLLSRYLHIPLMDAERAWSHAMELKLLANTELRKKFHYIRRLRKAASHATQLEELCSGDVCDARTKLEAQVQCF